MRRLGPLGALWAGYFMLYAYLIGSLVDIVPSGRTVPLLAQE